MLKYFDGRDQDELEKLQTNEECACICHIDKTTIHVMACCHYPCKFCDKHFKFAKGINEHTCYGFEQAKKNPKGRWKLK